MSAFDGQVVFERDWLGHRPVLPPEAGPRVELRPFGGGPDVRVHIDAITYDRGVPPAHQSTLGAVRARLDDAEAATALLDAAPLLLGLDHPRLSLGQKALKMIADALEAFAQRVLGRRPHLVEVVERVGLPNGGHGQEGQNEALDRGLTRDSLEVRLAHGGEGFGDGRENAVLRPQVRADFLIDPGLVVHARPPLKGSSGARVAGETQ